MTRAAVNADLCISSGNCVADAPTAFEFDDDEIARARPGVSSLTREMLIRVARRCPSGAISVIEDDCGVIDLD